MSETDEVVPPVCPKAAERLGNSTMPRWTRWMFPAAGLLSLIWFLLRVAPKPSRAAYPCQRTAAPLAVGFLLWFAGALASASLYRKAKELWRRSQVMLACTCLVIAAILGISTWVTVSDHTALASAPVSNQPIGLAKGLHPGRVVWAHDRNATNWEGPGQGHWWESSHTNQAVVDSMMSRVIRRLGGKAGDRQAWDALIKHFNQTRGHGKAGYRKGEKVTIKVNLVGCIIGAGVDPKSYDLVRAVDYMNTSPQMILALLRQLVRAAGVNQQDISVGDPLSLFPNQYYDLLHSEFPNVHYLDHDGGNRAHPRARVRSSSIPFYWSSRPAGKTQDYVPAPYAEAKYFINLANLKSHTMAGVTLCGKNHYGSLIRRPPEKGYYDMHASLPGKAPGSGQYRALVDLMGQAHTGGKTLLYLIDGLYPGVHPIETSPRKWSTAPFNGHWASSLFASQDPVAIDSVAFDFLWAEWMDYPHMSGAGDYLHEAALANNPPSGTFYDPDHATSTTRLASLGVHEHWNNAQDKQYGRNLGRKDGIELIRIAASR